MVGDNSGLRVDPFAPNTVRHNPYPSLSYRQALTSLYYSIEYGHGLLVLIGQCGSGKTTLIRQLESRMRLGSATLLLAPPPCDAQGLMVYLLGELKLDARGMDKTAMRSKLGEALKRMAQTRNRLLLIADDAQHLDRSALELICALPGEALPSGELGIVLAGTPELAERFKLLHLTTIKPVSVNPLGFADVQGYINHRLRTAGWTGDFPFSPGTCAAIARQSGGLPAQINALCSQALRTGNQSEPLQLKAAADAPLSPMSKLRLNWIASLRQLWRVRRTPNGVQTTIVQNRAAKSTEESSFQ